MLYEVITDLVTVAGEGYQGIQTDKRVSAPFFTTLHGFEQEGMGIEGRDFGKERNNFV